MIDEQIITDLRRLRLSELRAKWAIQATRARQLQSAIEVLADKRYDDETALKVSEDLINAPIGL